MKTFYGYEIPVLKMELQRYNSIKTVWAAEIVSINDNKLTIKIPPVKHNMQQTDDAESLSEYEIQVVVDKILFARYTPEPGDFYVIYSDGYQSISPRKPFIEGYIAA